MFTSMLCWWAHFTSKNQILPRKQFFSEKLQIRPLELFLSLRSRKMSLIFKFLCFRLKSHFWHEIITVTCPICNGVCNLPHKFHLYLIGIVNFIQKKVIQIDRVILSTEISQVKKVIKKSYPKTFLSKFNLSLAYLTF